MENKTMQELQMVKQLCDLNSQFKDIEEKSVSFTSTPKGHYLVVRLDGIGLSKKYLKDKVIHKQFQKVMIKAIEQTYYVLHRKSPSNAQQLFLGVVMASDEVSFILNTYDNYFDDRLFKIVTTIASTFTNFFTQEGVHKNRNLSITGSFDGKPLILPNLEDVNKYIAYRAAVYTRNSMAKLLRIKGVDCHELYNPKNNNNLDYYQMKFSQLNLQADALSDGCIVLVPSRGDDKKLNQFKNKSLGKLTTLSSKSIVGFDEWLHEENTKTAS
jgi:tRNA(His) 5'-end guanylyltransferase